MVVLVLFVVTVRTDMPNECEQPAICEIFINANEYDIVAIKLFLHITINIFTEFTRTNLQIFCKSTY